ncbi:MAG: phosphate ABC transporter, permease protein PstA [Verrucomicrobia bacterium Tous-C9LFEB]|nr:MAG: phosphate ABC transporter, permease protein PstA [Verrucomicrobia bacterium Tous-C9LFEB]
MNSIPQSDVSGQPLDLTSAPTLSQTTLFTALFRSVAFFLVGVVALLVAYIFSQGFHGLNPAFLFGSATSQDSSGMFDVHNAGVFEMVFGTILLVFLMTVLVMPVGVISGIYLNEFSDPNAWTTRIIRSAVNNLAGVPSIIFGLFGLGFFVYFIGGSIDDYVLHTASPVFGKPAVIWAALTLAVLTMPVVVVSTEQALRSVPLPLRDAALGLGATKLQTLRQIVLPQAAPGIITGGILAVSRGAGEVAPIMFTGAAYYLAHLPQSITDQFMELGYHIYILATQSPNVDRTRPLLFATVVVLLLLTFLLNLIAILVRAWTRHRMRSYRA